MITQHTQNFVVVGSGSRRVIGSQDFVPLPALEPHWKVRILYAKVLHHNFSMKTVTQTSS